jgi:hypothetical protein
MSLNVRGNADGANQIDTKKMEEDEIESLRKTLTIYSRTKKWIHRSISELDAKLESTMESMRSQELEFRRLTFAILDIDVKINQLRSNPNSINVHDELHRLKSERDANHQSLIRIPAIDRALSKDYENWRNKRKEIDDSLMEENTLQSKYDLLLQQHQAKYGLKNRP